MDGYLSIARAVAYLRGCEPDAAAARWGRRHLIPHVPHFRLPNSGPMFRIVDLDAFMQRHRIVPIDLDAVVRAVVPERKRAAR